MQSGRASARLFSMAHELSIVVPVYNEEENILPLARELHKTFARSGYDYELVFVDDGSTDATWEKIKTARMIEPRLRALHHAQNAGQSAALWTGMQSSD